MTRNLTQVGGSFIGTMEQFEFDTPDRRASTELYIFSQDDQLLTILSPETGLTEALYKESLNTLPDTPFTFTVDAEEERSQYVREENQVVFRDKEGDLQLFVIKELDDSDGEDGPLTSAICEPAFMELKEHIVVDRRMVNDTADVALDAALDGTRWTGSVEVELGEYTQNFYYETSIDAIWTILDVWGGEFKAVVEFDKENNVNRRTIKILQRRGSDTGLRWEIGHNVEEIQRTVLSYPITAMYGRGSSLEIEDEDGEATGGHSRYIDFGDAVWSEDDGDPVDKPEGQRWVGDPEALEKYGRAHNGELLHREDIFSDQDYEDEYELLQATWDALQDAKEPEVNYELSVHLLEFLAGYEHEHVELGDTTQAIDRNFGRPIEIEARVISIEYDLLDIEGTATVEMGQFLTALDDDRLDRVIDDINDNRGRWEHPDIRDIDYPDIEPSIPANLEAVGGFKSIQIYWEFNDESFIEHYELYASQSPDFVPSSENMIWRGDVNGFNHVVDTDEVWYYYVRAVNYHGRASDYSEQAEGSTVRIINEDILFGEDIAESLRDLSEEAGIIADGTIDFETFSEQVKDADGERIKGDLISVDGTSYIAEGVIGTAAIANAAIERAHLQDALIGSAQIDDAVIGNAHIADVSADKINAGTLRAINIDGVTITGSEIYQTSAPYAINIRSGELSTWFSGELRSELSGNGQSFYRDGNHIGSMGSSQWTGDPDEKGISFQLTNDASYMSWSHDDSGDGNYTQKLVWFLDNTIQNSGFWFNDFTRINPSYNLYLRTLSTYGYDTTNRHVQLQNTTWDNLDGVSVRRDSDGAYLFLARSVASIVNEDGYNIHVRSTGGGSVRSTTIYNRTTTNSNVNMRITNSGTIFRSTSSRRYKLLEEPLSLDYANKLLDIDAKSWFDRLAAEDYANTLAVGAETDPQKIERIPGVIAEDVHDAGLEMFVEYDEDGNPGDVNSNLPMLLLPIVKNLKAKNEELEKRLETLEGGNDGANREHGN